MSFNRNSLEFKIGMLIGSLVERFNPTNSSISRTPYSFEEFVNYANVMIHSLMINDLNIQSIKEIVSIYCSKCYILKNDFGDYYIQVGDEIDANFGCVRLTDVIHNRIKIIEPSITNRCKIVNLVGYGRYAILKNLSKNKIFELYELKEFISAKKFTLKSHIPIGKYNTQTGEFTEY